MRSQCNYHFLTCRTMCSAGLLLRSTPVEVSKGRKPHTKLQQKCLDLAKTLPPLTEAQKKWARCKMSGLGYYVTRGRKGKHSCIWCQECGQMDEVGLPPLAVAVKIKETKSHVCSRCGRKLEVTDWVPRWDHRHEMEHDFHFGIVTVCEGMQVVRMFDWHQIASMGSDTINHIDEVYQIWFEPDRGKQVIISKQYTRSWYHFRWNTYSEWKVKQNRPTGGYSYNDDVYSLDNKYIYPNAKILPILRRNGWSNKMFRMRTSPVDIWRALMTDPAIEGLAKNGQYSVIDYWMSTGGSDRDKSRWLPRVKICNRRKYVIKDASLWFDVVKSLRRLGMDDHSPKYICPADLHAMHDWLQRKVERLQIREEIRKLNSDAKNWEQFYAQSKGCFLGIKFNDGNIFCHVIKSVAEMCEEGKRMHHCVYRMGYYKRPESLILSARDREGKRLETVEVNLRTFKVVQSRGLQNQPTMAHSRIIQLVEQNMNLIKRAKAV